MKNKLYIIPHRKIIIYSHILRGSMTKKILTLVWHWSLRNLKVKRWNLEIFKSLVEICKRFKKIMLNFGASSFLLFQEKTLIHFKHLGRKFRTSLPEVNEWPHIKEIFLETNVYCEFLISFHISRSLFLSRWMFTSIIIWLKIFKNG